MVEMATPRVHSTDCEWVGDFAAECRGGGGEKDGQYFGYCDDGHEWDVVCLNMLKKMAGDNEIIINAS